MSDLNDHVRAGKTLLLLRDEIEAWHRAFTAVGKSTWPGHRHYLDRVRELLSASPVLAGSENANCEAKIAEARAQGRREALEEVVAMLAHTAPRFGDAGFRAVTLSADTIERAAEMGMRWDSTANAWEPGQ